jgi:hypothetical protein
MSLYILLFYITSKGYNLTFSKSSVTEETVRITIEGRGLRLGKNMTKEELLQSKTNSTSLCEIIYDLYCELERSQASRDGS